MKKITALLFACVGLFGLSWAQQVDDMTVQNDQDQVVVKERDGGLVIVDQKTNVEYAAVNPAPGSTHRRMGRAGEYAYNYYNKSRVFKYESLAGCMVDCDSNDVPFRKVACGNVLLRPTRTKIVTKTIIQERQTIRDIHHYHTVTVPGPERIIEVPGPERYVPILVLAPQQQYIANLSSPTVVSPVLSGIPALSFVRSNLSFGNGITANAQGGAGGVGNGGNATGGNGYGAAAAAAAASAASTSTAPGAAAGSGNGSSGSAGAGGGPSNSGTGG